MIFISSDFWANVVQILYGVGKMMYYPPPETPDVTKDQRRLYMDMCEERERRKREADADKSFRVWLKPSDTYPVCVICDVDYDDGQ